MAEHTFLSYSRQEYYFAESLTLNLQHRGLSVWFDVQQLEPGVNWKADIEDGLVRSQSLTLVASRAALASPYVEQEWRAALALNKPIFVAFYEQVHLPAELRSRAVMVDMRGNFDTGVKKLAEFLSAAQPPRSDGFLWLPRWSSGVRRMALTLLFDDLQIIAANMLAFTLLALVLYPGSLARLLLDVLLGDLLDVALAVDLIVAIFGIFLVIRYLINLRHRLKTPFFLMRDFDYSTLVADIAQEIGVGRLLYMLAVLAVSYVLPVDPPFLRDLGVIWALPVTYSLNIIIALLAAIFGVWIMNLLIRRFEPAHPNPDIVRWARLDKVSQVWRVAINSSVLGHGHTQLPSSDMIKQANAIPSVAAAPVVNPTDAPPGTYCVMCAPADEAVAQHVRESLSNMGYTETNPALHNMVILSYRTPLDILRGLAQSGRNIIGVLATDVRLVDEMQAVTSFQLVDVRQQNWSQMAEFFRFLTSDDEATRARFSQQVMPVNLASAGAHPGLQTLAQNLMRLVSLLMVFVAYFFVRMAYFSISLRPVAPAFVLPVTACVILLLLALALAWFALGVLHGVRRLPMTALLVALFVPLLLMPLVDLSGNLFGTVNFSVVTIEFSLNQTLVLIAFYIVISIYVIRSFRQQPYLLASPWESVLGMPPLRVRWMAVVKTLVFLLIVATITLISQP